MFVTPPKTGELLAARLLASGVQQDAIDAFMAQF